MNSHEKSYNLYIIIIQLTVSLREHGRVGEALLDFTATIDLKF